MAQVTFVKFADLEVGTVYAITNYYKYYNLFAKKTVVIELDGKERVSLPQWFADKHFDNMEDFFKDKQYFIFKGMKQCKSNEKFSYASIDFPQKL